MELKDNEIEELKEILEEYVSYFYKLKEHKKAHKKEPCKICNNARKILRKFKKELGDFEK